MDVIKMLRQKGNVVGSSAGETKKADIEIIERKKKREK